MLGVELTVPTLSARAAFFTLHDPVVVSRFLKECFHAQELCAPSHMSWGKVGAAVLPLLLKHHPRCCSSSWFERC